MIIKNLEKFKILTTSQAVTLFAGLPLLLGMAKCLGLEEELNALPIKKRDPGDSGAAGDQDPPALRQRGVDRHRGLKEPREGRESTRWPPRRWGDSRSWEIFQFLISPTSRYGGNGSYLSFYGGDHPGFHTEGNI